MEYIESKYFSYADPDDPIFKKLIIRSIEFCAGQPEIFKLYRKYQENPSNWESFWDGCVNLLNLEIDITKDRLENIPKEGSTIVVANHPFGVLDGLVLSWLVSKRRDDFKLLVHSLLLRAPETKKYLLPIDFTGDKNALLTNIETRKIARRHLADGGSVIIFPAGSVSTTSKFYQNKDKAFDCEWKKFTSRLIKQSDATIVPVYFSGSNSGLFQFVSHFSTMLRSSLLFHEVKRRINTKVPFIVGDSFKYSELNVDYSNDELADYLRKTTYLLNKKNLKTPPLGFEPPV